MAGNTVRERMTQFEKSLVSDTGRGFDDWVEFTKQSGPAAQAARVAWLRNEHRLPKDAAWVIASTASGAADYRDELALLEGMFAGKREALRPVYDALAATCRDLGDDVGFSPCRTQVSVKRRHNIIVLRPATNTRVDVGLALGDAVKPTARLVDTGGLAKGDRVTRRVGVASVDEIDDQLRRWMRTAYDLDA